MKTIDTLILNAYKCFTICCLFRLSVWDPLFSDLLIGGLPPNSCQHQDTKKMQAEEPSQIGKVNVFQEQYSFKKKSSTNLQSLLTT